MRGSRPVIRRIPRTRRLGEASSAARSASLTSTVPPMDATVMLATTPSLVWSAIARCSRSAARRSTAVLTWSGAPLASTPAIVTWGPRPLPPPASMRIASMSPTSTVPMAMRFMRGVRDRGGRTPDLARCRRSRDDAGGCLGRWRPVTLSPGGCSGGQRTGRSSAGGRLRDRVCGEMFRGVASDIRRGSGAGRSPRLP